MEHRTDSPPRRSTDAAVAALILVLGLVLLVSGIVMLSGWQKSSLRLQSFRLEDVLGGLSSGCGLLIVLWWSASLLLALGSAVLQKAGHQRASAAMGRTSPAFMRRLALAALGLHLVACPVTAHAAAQVPQVVSIPALWAPTAHPAGDATPTHNYPQGDDVRGDGAGTDRVLPHWKPTAPLSETRLFTAPPLRTAPTGGSPHAPAQVTVLCGDSLWSIAARSLGPQASDLDVALLWPRWYEANRTVIGNNPDILRPGQVLQAPSAA